MTQVKIENLHKLGQLLKDSAEAIKTLADSIAHIVRLGDSAWSEVSARRTRSRLKRLHQDLTAFAEVQGERRDEIQELVNRLSRDDVELPRITINWEEAMLEVGELALALEQILSDVRQERSDFILEPAYRSLQQSLAGRRRLFQELVTADRPRTQQEIKALRVHPRSCAFLTELSHHRPDRGPA